VITDHPEHIPRDAIAVADVELLEASIVASAHGRDKFLLGTRRWLWSYTERE
jgi:hypothetical protein